MDERTENRIAFIHTLADGTWHSGEALARALGISRAAVWKRLKTLEGWGLDVQAVTGKGYRLAQPIEFLERTRVEAALSDATRQALDGIDIHAVLDSTNAWLMAQPFERARLCLAEFQTAGRGRRGRSWVSPFGANLYLSLGWRFEATPAHLSALSLAVGVGLVDLFARLGLDKVRLKWPNDIWFDGRKLGGILIEHRGETGGPARVVVGVGLNCRMSDMQAGAIDQPWTDLASAFAAADRAAPTRNSLAAMTADALVRTLKQFETAGFAVFAQRWKEFDALRDASVVLSNDQGEHRGTARGIDADGAFLLRCNGRDLRFLSGDITLRPLA